MPEINVEINGVGMKMMIDTGASTDIMNKGAFQKIKQTQPIKLTEVSVEYLPTVHRVCL